MQDHDEQGGDVAGGRAAREAQSGLPWLGPETQLSLFPEAEARAPDAVRALLESRLGARVRLATTRNRTSILTFRRAKDGSIDLRMHTAFLDAPDEVLDAIACFLVRPARAAREKVAAFFHASGRAERKAPRLPPPPASLRTRGKVFDLGEVFAALNARYFGGHIASRITWGSTRAGAAGDPSSGRPPAGGPGDAHDAPDLDFFLEGELHAAPSGPEGPAPRAPFTGARAKDGFAPAARKAGRGRTIRFGSYLADQDLIRIHPALDASWVPRFFLESIVYHEMLHAVIPIARETSGRRCIHPPEFRKREREFHAFDAALDWERVNLPRLLGTRA